MSPTWPGLRRTAPIGGVTRPFRKPILLSWLPNPTRVRAAVRPCSQRSPFVKLPGIRTRGG